MEGVRYELEDDELIIFGSHVALGYWNRPELNGKCKRNGVRFFRTGDAVRQLGDGTFQFLGRIDRQLKLRGKLIAPEEIEAALCLSPTVRRAHVVKLGEVLFAFIESVETSSFDSIQSSLHTRLPDWMIPKNGQIMGRFPCTPSGKIDSRALLDSLEIQTSSDLWTDLFSRTLGIPVGPLDDFLKWEETPYRFFL